MPNVVAVLAAPQLVLHVAKGPNWMIVAVPAPVLVSVTVTGVLVGNSFRQSAAASSGEHLLEQMDPGVVLVTLRYSHLPVVPFVVVDPLVPLPHDHRNNTHNTVSVEKSV